MGLKNIVFIIVFISAFTLLFYNIKRLISYLTIGKKENRFDNIPQRIKNVITIAFGQSKLMREPLAGTIHFLIFWGFMLFLFAVIEAIIQGFYSKFTLEFLGPVYSIITFIQEVFGILIIGSVLVALYRRLIQKVKRLDVGPGGQVDAVFILSMILVVVISMFGQNASDIANHGFILRDYEVRPISAIISPLIYLGHSSTSELWYEIFWWSHIIVIFGFMNGLIKSRTSEANLPAPLIFIISSEFLIEIDIEKVKSYLI